MTERDIFDVLRSGDPAPPGITPGPDSPLGRRIHATVMANATDPSATPRRRRRIIAVLVAVATLAGAGAAWALNTRSVTDSVSVLCYDAPSTTASAIEAPRAAIPDTAACRALWDDGVLPINSDLPRGQVPPLISCVNNAGTYVVFPSDNTNLCTELGLTDPAPLPAGPDTTHDLTQQLVDAINPATCLSLDEAEKAAIDIFDKLGLGEWSVAKRPENPERPCASLAIDEKTRLVILVPIPLADGPTG